MKKKRKSNKLNLKNKQEKNLNFYQNGNPDSIEMWKNFTKYSISAMKIMLKRLWVEVEFNIWEFYEGLNLPKMENYPDLTYSMSDIVKELIEKKYCNKKRRLISLSSFSRRNKNT